MICDHTGLPRRVTGEAGTSSGDSSSAVDFLTAGGERCEFHPIHPTAVMVIPLSVQLLLYFFILYYQGRLAGLHSYSASLQQGSGEWR